MKRICFCILLLFIASTSWSQTEIVKGKVTDSTNAPLSGVSISIKGTHKGTTTNNNGEFTINVSKGNTLLISSIGYLTKEIVIGEKTDINVSLVQEASENAPIIVNVGFGTLDKKEVSSAIVHLSAKDLLSGNNNSVLMAIDGKVAGLTVDNTSVADPNSTPTLQLRGVSSRSAGLTPLFVVDGVPGANIDNINQNDIASIDVLKGGAAAAIYGTRGSNGVVLITTKRGISGEPQTLYDAFVSTNYATDVPKLLSGKQYLAHNLGPDAGGSTDWLHALTRNMFSQKHTLQFSGGNRRTNYLASADYANSYGLDLRSSKQQYGANINLNHTTADNLFVFSLKVAPRYANTNTSNSGEFNEGLVLNPTQPIYDSTGHHFAYVPNGGIGLFNPVEDAERVLAQQEIKELDISGSAQLNILRNLNTKVTVNETSFSMKTLGFSPSTLTTVQTINGGTGFNGASQKQEETDTKSFEWITNYSLYHQKHSLNLLGGYSYVLDNYQEFDGSNQNFPFDAYTWNNLGSGLYDQGQGITNINSYQDADKLIAFFGRVNYNFDEKYFLMASLRHEGSSRFGSGKQWGNFPGISAAWQIMEEKFMRGKIHWLTELKLRADYGVTGNQNFADYQALETYTGFDFYPYNGTTYQVLGPASNANPKLQWELSKSFNVGLDFTLFENRISGSINYYTNTSTNLLGSYNVPIPPNLQGQTYLNVGSMKNSGIELQANAGIIKGKNFSYDISITGATLNNKLISLSNQVYNGGTFLDGPGFAAPGSPGSVQRLQEGQRIGNFYTLHATGVNSSGELLVETADGKTVTADQASTSDRQIEGNGLPKYTVSMGNTFRYKNWDLSIFLRGAFGYKLFNTQAFYLGQPGRAGAGFNLLASAFGGGKYSKLTSAVTAPILSDYFLEPGDFVKIDNVSLGYSKTLTLKYIKSVRIYATGTNLHTFTKFTGGDPSLISQTGLWPGANTNLSYYPSAIQLLLGLQVYF